MKPEELKNIVREKYGKIAEQGSDNTGCGSSSCCGPEVDYTVFSENYEKKDGYIADADLNLGCGIPTDYAGIRKGDHVLDLGSGAGNDCFVARAIVGETGRVTGLDFTEQMVRKARENCEKLNFTNVEFVMGDIEKMPFDDSSFDVVISNCVLNLVPDKKRAFSEIFRVLKPMGRFCVSDVVIKGTMTEKIRKDAELYAGCVSGASNMEDYLRIIDDKGFLNTTIHKQKEIRLPETIMQELSGRQDENSSNEERGIYSITVSARKPVTCGCGGKC